MKIKSLPEDERPVEKTLRYGPACLSNAEVLAILLGTGTREKSAIGLAEDILAFSGNGISGLSAATVQEMMQIPGIGQSKAARIACAVELGKRIATRPKERRISIHRSSDVAELFMEELRHETKERFKAIMLNAKGEITAVETISVGELSSTPVHPREVFSIAVRRSAAAVIFAHNHPSGDPTPSDEDILLTKRLMDCGNLLGIAVLDHIVIGDGSFISMAEQSII